MEGGAGGGDDDRQPASKVTKIARFAVFVASDVAGEKGENGDIELLEPGLIVTYDAVHQAGSFFF